MNAARDLNVGTFTFPSLASSDNDHQEHHHFTCESCKRVYDVQLDISDLPGRIGEQEGFDAEDINIVNLSFSGICWQCK